MTFEEYCDKRIAEAFGDLETARQNIMQLIGRPDVETIKQLDSIGRSAEVLEQGLKDALERWRRS